MKTLMLGIALTIVVSLTAEAQRPDTVFFEDLTFDEIRDAIANGSTNVIIAAGGLADGGASHVTGRPGDIVTYTADRIARTIGGTLVGPVIAYEPDGVISVPEAGGFLALVEAAAVGAKGSGFRNIFLISESAGSQSALKAVAEKLNASWTSDGVGVTYVSDYVVRAGAEQEKYLTQHVGFTSGEVEERARFVEVSEALAINGQRVRLDVPDRPGAAPGPQHGLALLEIKVDSAVAQIRTILGSATPFRSRTTGPQVFPTPHPRRAVRPSLFLEDLTATEIRQAIAEGKTTVIVPTGGTEKNGFHMAMGKHNFHVRAGAQLMAETLGNALIAPVLQYVPEGRATLANPGVLSCAAGCFEPVVESIARSVRQLGFKDILLIGDNGGNQAPLRNVAGRLNEEWANSDARTFALTDFYDKGHEYQDAWFLAQFGWDSAVVGSHAGIKDTSQLLYVKPESVRKNRIAESLNNREESSISGDPTKATLEFGRVGIAFKANGAIAQYLALKTPAEGGRGGRTTGRRGNR